MNRVKLLRAIEKVKPAITATSLTEQNNLVLFNKKTVQSYNDEILIITPIKVKIAGAIPANELITLLQKMKDKKIEIKQKGKMLEITGGSTKAKLKVSGVEFPEADLPTKWKTLPEDFIDGIKYCRFSIAQPGTILGNILCTHDAMISCDNFRVTEYIMKKDVFKKNCLIPSTTINALLSFLPTSFSPSKQWIYFKNKEGAVLCIRSVEEKYPDVESILNSKVKGVKIKLPDALKEALLRTRILSDEDTETGNKMITINIKGGKLVCHGECATGEIDETIKFKHEGRAVSFTIVPDFLSEILDKTQTMTVGETSLKFKTKKLQHLIMLMVKKS